MGRTKPEDRLMLMGDFETTVYPGQKDTEVWASVLVPLYTEDALLFHSIDETFEYIKALKKSCVIYYHNLKFDGTFWLDFLIKRAGLKQAVEKIDDIVKWQDTTKMSNNSFKYLISDEGNWYSITIKLSNRIIEIRDSLKLLPFSVKRIGDSFKTKHRKGTMEYTGYRYAGCTITDEERDYIFNDAFVVKEALEIMFDEGHKKLTIGSCCLEEFKRLKGKEDYEQLFPNLFDIDIPEGVYGSATAGEYIRRSYRGGWCYVAKGKENRMYHRGITCDVNSLYSSVMHSMSGNEYPWGKPVFWSGNEIPEKALKPHRYFFVRIRTRFKLKKNYLPFIQIKGSLIYRATEMLESSDFKSKIDGEYYRFFRTTDGERHDTYVTMTLTCTDWYLIQKHYDLIDCTILDGCYFNAMSGIFDEYINHYKKIKQENSGAVRELAKLFLNNLYGKLASSTNSSFKVAYRDGDTIKYSIVDEEDKTPGYIACGSAITSYARAFTITAAQANYHGVDKPGFIYGDTDSIHCDLPAEAIVGAPQHDTEFCHWKYEATWDYGLFVRQKTYIEHVVEENLKPIENPYYNVKCAGMPDNCKQLFLHSVFQDYNEEDYSGEELEFLKVKRTLEDFKVGLKIPGKLLPVQIPGGTVLVETTYEMR